MTKDEWNRRKGRQSKRVRKSLRFSIYLRDRFRCVYCGTLHEIDGKGLTLDHVTPRSKGGGFGADNLVTACSSCNSRRQHKPLADWLRSLLPCGTAACACPACPITYRRLRSRVTRALKRPCNREAGRILARIAP